MSNNLNTLCKSVLIKEDISFPPLTYKRSNHYKPKENDVLVFDCGSYQTRAGWYTSPNLIQFDSIVSKPKIKPKGKNSFESIINVGSNCYSSATAISSIKSPFETNVLTSGEMLEHIIDYALLNLGVDRIQCPVLLTEQLANPIHSRKIAMELMFECYEAPSLNFGVDSLFAYNLHSKKEEFGLVISASNYITDIIPIWSYKPNLVEAKKLNYGGAIACQYLHKLMQMKYPSFPVKMNAYQAKSMSEEAQKESAEQIKEKRKLQAKKMKEQAEKSRYKRLSSKQQDLAAFQELKLSAKTVKKQIFTKMLEDYGFADEEDLDKTIEATKRAIAKIEERNMEDNKSEIKETYNFDLLDTPDDQLSDDSKKEKRKLKLIKSGMEAREKAKKAKEEKEKKEKEAALKDEECRKKNFEEWLRILREKYQVVKDRMITRKKNKQQMNKRKSHLSQMKMKSIAQLAADDSDKKTKSKKDDNFGMQDSDWNVYNFIKKSSDNNYDVDSEEDDWNLIDNYESLLIEHDPEFDQNLKFTNIINEFGDEERTDSIYYRFMNGLKEKNDIDKYSINLNVERCRVPEILFQPNINGIDQAGLGEILDMLIRKMDKEDVLKMVNNVVLTGGYSRTKNLRNRLIETIRPISPTGAIIKIKQSQSPHLDAYYGAKKFIETLGIANFKSISFSLERYKEVGLDYLFDHDWSNKTL